MSYLSMVEARLPPGFRFHPRDEELVCDYLAKKIAGDNSGSLFGGPTMIDVDLNKVEPWDLPGKSLQLMQQWCLLLVSIAWQQFLIFFLSWSYDLLLHVLLGTSDFMHEFMWYAW